MSQFLWCDKNRSACLFCNDKVTRIPFHGGLWYGSAQCTITYSQEFDLKIIRNQALWSWFWNSRCRSIFVQYRYRNHFLCAASFVMTKWPGFLFMAGYGSMVHSDMHYCLFRRIMYAYLKVVFSLKFFYKAVPRKCSWTSMAFVSLKL